MFVASPIAIPVVLLTQVIVPSFPATAVIIGLSIVIITLSVPVQPVAISVLVKVNIFVLVGFAVGLELFAFVKSVEGDQE